MNYFTIMVKLSLYNNYKLLFFFICNWLSSFLLDTSTPSLQSFHLSIQSLFKATKLWDSEKINLWAIEFNMSHDATTNARVCLEDTPFHLSFLSPVQICIANYSTFLVKASKCGKLSPSPFNSHLFWLYIFQILTAHLVDFAVNSGAKLC